MLQSVILYKEDPLLLYQSIQNRQDLSDRLATRYLIHIEFIKLPWIQDYFIDPIQIPYCISQSLCIKHDAKIYENSIHKNNNLKIN
jgi:hypothetical protein